MPTISQLKFLNKEIMKLLQNKEKSINLTWNCKKSFKPNAENYYCPIMQPKFSNTQNRIIVILTNPQRRGFKSLYIENVFLKKNELI